MDQSQDLTLSVDQRDAFSLAQRAATHVLKRRTRLVRLLARSMKKLTRNERALARAKDDLRALIRLANAWANRQYHNVPWRSVLYATAALIYFVNPIDLIPDALIGIGFVDDIAVLTAVVRAIRKDLKAFRIWEHGRRLDAPEVAAVTAPSVALLDA